MKNKKIKKNNQTFIENQPQNQPIPSSTTTSRSVVYSIGSATYNVIDVIIKFFLLILLIIIIAFIAYFGAQIYAMYHFYKIVAGNDNKIDSPSFLWDKFKSDFEASGESNKIYVIFLGIAALVIIFIYLMIPLRFKYIIFKITKFADDPWTTSLFELLESRNMTVTYKELEKLAGDIKSVKFKKEILEILTYEYNKAMDGSKKKDNIKKVLEEWKQKQIDKVEKVEKDDKDDKIE